LKHNWYREIEQWKKEEKHIWRIVTKEEFRRDWVILTQFGLDGLIIDESHFFASPTSQLHKNMIKYLAKVKPNCVYLLTGTVFTSSPYSVMCHEKLLGRKASYMDYKKRFFNNIRMGKLMIPVMKKGIEPKIAKIVNSMGTTATKDECLDLPMKVFLREDFMLTPEQDKEIERLDDDPLCATAIVYFTKYHQICGGTLKTKFGNKTFRCEKLERIKEYAAEYPKFIVVCRYNNELEMLHQNLENSRILNGATENRQELVDWANEEENAILLINASISEGINLQGMNLMLFYSNGFSYKNRVQMQGRVHRAGQKRTCTYVDLVVRGSVDEAVLQALKKKEDFLIEIYAKKQSLTV